MASKYTIPDYADNDLDDILNYGKFGRCVYRTELKWDSGKERNDLIAYNPSEHEDELRKDLKLSPTICDESKQGILSIIKKYWDCFVTIGAKRWGLESFV